ncbi:hypothetical protein D3C79_700250 [compost metagenome]
MAELPHIGEEALVPVFIGHPEHELFVGGLVLRPDRAQQHMTLILEPGSLFQLGRVGADGQRQHLLPFLHQDQPGIQDHHLVTTGLQRVQIQFLNLREGQQQLRQLAQHLTERIDIEPHGGGLLADLAVLEGTDDLIAR